MTIRTIFTLVLKILGLLFVRDFLVTLPHIFSGISVLINTGGDDLLSPLAAIFFSVGVYGLLAWLLLFRTEGVIDALKLDSHFREASISFSMHRADVLRIAVILIGGLMIAEAVPVLLRQVFQYIQYLRYKGSFFENYEAPDDAYFFTQVAQVILGLLLLGYQRQIINYIELKRRA